MILMKYTYYKYDTYNILIVSPIIVNTTSSLYHDLVDSLFTIY